MQKVLHLEEPRLESAVQENVKPKYLKEAACVIAGGNPRPAGLVGVDHLWMHAKEGLDDHILQRGGARRGGEVRG